MQNTAWGFVGTQQGVGGLTPRPFTLGEEAGMRRPPPSVAAVGRRRRSSPSVRAAPPRLRAQSHLQVRCLCLLAARQHSAFAAASAAAH